MEAHLFNEDNKELRNTIDSLWEGFKPSWRIVTNKEMSKYNMKDVPIKFHRRKRIQKKWIKRYGTKMIEDKSSYCMMVYLDCIMCHPDVFDKVNEKLNGETK